MFKKIVGVFTAIIAFAFVIAIITEPGAGKFYGVIGAIIFSGVTYLLLFEPKEKTEKRKAKRAEKNKLKEEQLKLKKQEKNEKIEQKKQEKENKIKEFCSSCQMNHINGLPFAEDTKCTINYLEDKFVITSGTVNFELEKRKITDICIKTDQEIQKQYVSSVGGAVGGAVLFGPLGAIIGGRAKKKKIKGETHSYMIITYTSDNEIKYIGFEVPTTARFAANYYVEEFEKNTSTYTRTIQL